VGWLRLRNCRIFSSANYPIFALVGLDLNLARRIGACRSRGYNRVGAGGIPVETVVQGRPESDQGNS